MNLNQVTLPATNVERSAEFYRALGFTQIVSDLPSYARFECPEGEATFSLHLADSVPASGVVVYFECQDIDAVCSALAERGIAFDSTPTDQSWLWREARSGRQRPLPVPCGCEQTTPALAPRTGRRSEWTK
jgi:catechol 2,3-dioxygenase-like lactoylglutathione lyase family enzyme